MLRLKPFQIYLAALILIELILSAYIAYGQTLLGSICVIGQGCSIVQASKYAYFLGVKTSVWGIAAFTLLFILYGWSYSSFTRYHLYLAATLLGSLLALYFMFLQFFVLKQLCSSCLVVDTLMLLITALSLHEYRTFVLSARPPHLRKHY